MRPRFRPAAFLVAAVLAASAAHVAADPPRRSRVDARYARMRRRWHEPPSARERAALRRVWPIPLTLRPVHRGGALRLVPDGPGAFDVADLEAARTAFAPRGVETAPPIHPRLLTLLWRAVLKFRVPYLHLVSGYRETRATSRHNQGRAADVVLPGVGDARLAAFFRLQGFVGVGLYTTSGFVHVDVRARSFFWVDRSGPGRANRTQPILEDRVRDLDRRARRRGEEPTPDLALPEGTVDAPGDGEGDPLLGLDPELAAPDALAPQPASPAGEGAP